MRIRRDQEPTEAESGTDPEIAPEPLNVHQALTGVTRQIEEIIASAERTAQELKAEAEAEAERTRDEARVEAERTLTESRAEAERLTSESAAEAEQATSESRAEAERLVSESRAEAERLAAEHEDAARRRADERLQAAGEAEARARSVAQQVGAAVAGLRLRLDEVGEELLMATAVIDSTDGGGLESNGDRPSGEPGSGTATKPDRASADEAEDTAAAELAGSDDEAAQARPLVRAVQMAMAGASREEIGAVLRDEYRVEDPRRIIDEALGSRG